MTTDRPSFGRRENPPEITARVGALAVLLLIAVILLTVRWYWLGHLQVDQTVVVEVAGFVPDPGYHPLSAPARVHAALRAAGVDPGEYVDAELQAGTRLVVQGGGAYKLERMDELLVFGLPIDVNTAGTLALESIPGIGASRAAAIIAEREANGPFVSVDELVRVKGIGPVTVEGIRPFVVVER